MAADHIQTSNTPKHILTTPIHHARAVCSSRHVPGYVEKGETIKGKGVDEVYCIAGNDAFVMDAWGKSFGPDSGVKFLADQVRLCVFVGGVLIRQHRPPTTHTYTLTHTYIHTYIQPD